MQNYAAFPIGCSKAAKPRNCDYYFNHDISCDRRNSDFARSPQNGRDYSTAPPRSLGVMQSWMTAAHYGIRCKATPNRISFRVGPLWQQDSLVAVRNAASVRPPGVVGIPASPPLRFYWPQAKPPAPAGKTRKNPEPDLRQARSVLPRCGVLPLLLCGHLSVLALATVRARSDFLTSERGVLGSHSTCWPAAGA